METILCKTIERAAVICETHKLHRITDNNHLKTQTIKTYPQLFFQTLAATQNTGLAASSIPFSAHLWLLSSSEEQHRQCSPLDVAEIGIKLQTQTKTHLVKDVEVPLIGRLAGHSRLL